MIKNIVKRIIVGVAIALILSFIGSKISNALVIPVNPSQYIIQNTDVATTFTPNGTGYVGVGYLIGNIMVTQQVGNFVQPVWTATLVTGGKYYGCEMGTVATSDSTQVGTVVVQTFKCPVTLDGSNNVGQLFFAVSQNGVNSGNGVISIGRASIVLDENTQLLTEIRNAQLQELSYIMQYLQPIWGRLGGANDYLYGISQKIDTFIANSNSNTQDIIDNQNTNAQNTQDKIDDVKDTITDDNVDNPTDYSSNVASNGVITQLITLPITLFQKILNSTSASCTPFNLGSLYGHNLTMPCINLQNVLGSTLYNVIDILISGLFIYSISRKMVKVFNSLSSMKEGDVING